MSLEDLVRGIAELTGLSEHEKDPHNNRGNDYTGGTDQQKGPHAHAMGANFFT